MVPSGGCGGDSRCIREHSWLRWCQQLRGRYRWPVADELHLSLGAAGRAVDKLVGLSMVSRREDEHDRRIKRVSLAEGGEKTVALSIRRREDSVREVIATLPGDLRADLNSALLPVLAGDYLSTPMCSDKTGTGSSTQGLAAATSAAAPDRHSTTIEKVTS